MTSSVRLAAIDSAESAEALLAVAVAEADPADVMPPVAGPPGWTAARRAAFRAFHRLFFQGLAGPHRTIMFGVVADGHLVGMIRMRRSGADSVETGMWLGRSARGRGIGSAALRALVAEAAAAGARTVVAETTSDNHAALAALRRCGALLTADPTSGKVVAVIAVPMA
ncbi:GNAT family N-acetyltransferase [Actinomycetes bacterium KLBMP 9797]